ncbi:Radical_SAM C-terminal domain protein [Acididesulfobacillus acetoxydans]|uniref:Fe-S oxidoreductase n=1 Tax=Acididesulfobacillus acetoxydans TaxID=1561005 RepID=A0A8S0X4B5_9FIRM|nr:TIGR01212 family radical SAM protein [Acididesulfobacillus acetoxydans]CAA7600680.1 Radical_SAM C-terminal domain protein [Acididesulfobacillus acetoxydans]CEJ09461.1 Fe-S oxidoreductase [Acididesulfobacillus acetoxydans]
MRWGEKRYNNFNGHLRQVFGEKVFKVPLDAGFTCPNRDGTLGSGGCVYCSARGSGDFAGEQGKSISVQFAQVKEQMRKKWPRGKYLAYFQAYTNTYAPVGYLRKVFEEALTQDGVVGLSVATRPDCLPDDVLDYLQELQERTYLWVELGLQTIHKRSLEWMRRGHDYSAFLEGLAKLRERGVRVCAHLILGLPGESRRDIMATAEAVAQLPLQGIKLHLLHVLKGTTLARLYEREPFPLLTKEEYVTYVADILEILPPEMIIQRLTGDGPPDDLIAPLWSLRKWEILNGIDKELTMRGSWQGKRAVLTRPAT